MALLPVIENKEAFQNFWERFQGSRNAWQPLPGGHNNMKKLVAGVYVHVGITQELGEREKAYIQANDNYRIATDDFDLVSDVKAQISLAGTGVEFANETRNRGELESVSAELRISAHRQTGGREL